MGYGSGLYGHILNGLDIVAATYKAAGNVSYPASAQYGIVVGIDHGVMMFPVCFKVGMAGVYILFAMAPNGDGVGLTSLQLTTAGATYSTGRVPIAIIWFG